MAGAGEGAYMTVTDAAREIGVSERTILHRIKTGSIRAERFGRRVWMVPADEVHRLRGAGRLKPGPKPKEPTSAGLRRDEAEHQEALEEGRRRIRGETDEER